MFIFNTLSLLASSSNHFQLQLALRHLLYHFWTLLFDNIARFEFHNLTVCVAWAYGLVYLDLCFLEFTCSKEVRVKVVFGDLILKHDSLFSSLILKRFV